MKKVDELLKEATNPAIKAFLLGIKDAVDLVPHFAQGGEGKVNELLGAPRTGAQAKGRELGEALLRHLVH